MNATAAQALASAIDQSELVGLQRAGAFLSQHQLQRKLHHAHSPPIAIPQPQHLVASAPEMCEVSDECVQPRAAVGAQPAALARPAPAASASFLAAIRQGLHDNSPSWDNNGWFIGDDSDDEDDDDDFYTSMLYPYGGAETTSYAGCCAPAGSFARFAVAQAPSPAFVDFDITSATSGPIQREGSLIFAMEV